MEQRTLERITSLERELYALRGRNFDGSHRNQSDELAEFAAAFSKAQGEYETVIANKENPFFKSKYADIDAIVRAVRPAFKKYGLSFYQSTTVNGQKTVLHSRVMHSSGQWIEGQILLLPPKDDIQSFGSTMSYQQRYAARNILGITTSDEPIDSPPPRRAPYIQRISQEQLQTLTEAIGDKEFLNDILCDKFNIKSLNEMKNSDFPVVMGIIKKAGQNDE